MTRFRLLGLQVPRMVSCDIAIAIERKSEEIEQWRKLGMRILAAGVWVAEVARMGGVPCKLMFCCTMRHEKGRIAPLQRPTRLVDRRSSPMRSAAS